MANAHIRGQNEKPKKSVVKTCKPHHIPKTGKYELPKNRGGG
jgi:hypothetical protein